MAAGRAVVIGTRVTMAEAKVVDEMRGSLSRAQFMRLLVLQEKKRRGLG